MARQLGRNHPYRKHLVVVIVFSIGAYDDGVQRCVRSKRVLLLGGSLSVARANFAALDANLGSGTIVPFSEGTSTFHIFLLKISFCVAYAGHFRNLYDMVPPQCRLFVG